MPPLKSGRTSSRRTPLHSSVARAAARRRLSPSCGPSCEYPWTPRVVSHGGQHTSLTLLPLPRVLLLVPASRTRLGFHVITVSEVATQLFADVGGYDPRWEGTARHVSLQVILLQMQLSNEIACRGIAALRPEPCILLHDRAAQDGAAFCSVEEWGRVLTEANTTDARLSARYDLVVQLESTASETAGKIYQYGDGGTNPVRFHNRQQAELADRRSQQVGRARSMERDLERESKSRAVQLHVHTRTPPSPPSPHPPSRSQESRLPPPLQPPHAGVALHPPTALDSRAAPLCAAISSHPAPVPTPYTPLRRHTAAIRGTGSCPTRSLSTTRWLKSSTLYPAICSGTATVTHCKALYHR